jgi:hypothetical protein
MKLFTKEYCESPAKAWGADPDRVIVWHAFSNFYLDTYFDEEDLQSIEDGLASSPFSIAELAHIAFHEVMPVCISNALFFWGGGEWLAFDNDWLIPKCLQLQKNRPFRTTGDPDNIPRYLKLVAPLYTESYFMVHRVARIRKRGEVGQ